MAQFPAPEQGIVLTHFTVASDVGRSRRFYVGVLGGEVLQDGEPSIVALANSWIIINTGGPPTDDKPRVTLEPLRRRRPRHECHQTAVAGTSQETSRDCHSRSSCPRSTPTCTRRRTLPSTPASGSRWPVVTTGCPSLLT
jgi:hypothetical protein